MLCSCAAPGHHVSISRYLAWPLLVPHTTAPGMATAPQIAAGSAQPVQVWTDSMSQYCLVFTSAAAFASTVVSPTE
jgi:hypothetical protein